MTEITPPKKGKTIKKIEWLAVIFGLIALLASLPFKSAKISLSIVAGSVTSIANFVILSLIVVGMLNGDTVKPSRLIGKIVAKLVILVAIVVAILTLPVNGPALMIGISATVLAVIVGGLTTQE